MDSDEYNSNYGQINIMIGHEPGYRTAYGFNKPSFGPDTAIIEKFSINEGENENESQKDFRPATQEELLSVQKYSQGGE